MIRDLCKRIPRRLAAILAGLAICIAVPAHTQTFPEPTVKLIVPVPPGGSTDPIARLVTLRMQAILGQPGIIANHPGPARPTAARSLPPANPAVYTPPID